MASLVLWTCPTARKRTRWCYGLRPSPAGLTAKPYASHFPSSPGFRTWSVCTCSRSLTPGSWTGTRTIAPAHVAFPSALRGRHSRAVISELHTAPVEDPDSSGCVPLLTLRHAITGRRRISAWRQTGLGARADRYSLLSSGLSPPTPCRLLPALSGRPALPHVPRERRSRGPSRPNCWQDLKHVVAVSPALEYGRHQSFHTGVTLSYCLENANVPNEDVSSTYIVFFDPKLALQRISLDMLNVNKALFATKKCDTEAK